MTKVFAIGTGPLLEKGVKKIGGQCLRTWHLVSPLLEDGHHVQLVTLPIPDRENPPEKFRESSEKRKFEGFAYTVALTEDPSFLYPFLLREIKNLKPDCVLGINTHPSGVVARVAGRIPFWADLNGWAMAEGQTCAFLEKNDALLSHFWRDERDSVRRGDHFSTVSQNQKYALIGELAVCGRLNQFTVDFPFVDVIENAVNIMFLKPPPQNAQPALRGDKIPQDAFAALWSGGYNTWTDVDLLYNALMEAMRQNEKIHFISTGGGIDGHDEKTYARFHRLVAASPFRKRFILLGWVEAERLPLLYSECDIGINVDAINYETLFGARNRVTNMLAAGLPVVTTLGTEISRTIQKKGVGYAAPLDDASALASAICEMAGDEEKRRLMGRAAREFALSHYSYETTTRSLREWIKTPVSAPDNEKKMEGNEKGNDLLKLWNSDLEKIFALLQDSDVEDLRKAERDLAAIRSKPLFRLYKKLTFRQPF